MRDEKSSVLNRHTTLAGLLATTAVWIVILLPMIANRIAQGTTSETLSTGARIASGIAWIGVVSSPFMILMGVIAGWVLFFQGTYRQAIYAILFPLLGPLLILIGWVGIWILG
jgi:hypothetical protein